MGIQIQTGLEDGSVGGPTAIEPSEVSEGFEDKWVSVFVGVGIVVMGTEHGEVELEGEKGGLETSSEGADHYIEGEVIGLGDLGEEEGGVGLVLELDEFGEEVVGVVEGVGEELGMDLFQGVEGVAMVFEEGEDVMMMMMMMNVTSITTTSTCTSTSSSL